MMMNAGSASVCLVRGMVVASFLIVSVSIFVLISVSQNDVAPMAYRQLGARQQEVMTERTRGAPDEQEMELVDAEVLEDEHTLDDDDDGKEEEEEQHDEEEDLEDEVYEENALDQIAGEDEAGAEDVGRDKAAVGSESESKLSTATLVLEKRLPDCLIIGVRKGGTRPIVHFLTLHPQVVAMGPEMGFFSTEEKYAQGLDWYRDQMPPVTKDQVLIEKSADYFQHTLTPERVHSMNSSIKLILIVRDPVERMISDYYFLKRYAERIQKSNVTSLYRFMELEYSLEDLLYNRTTGRMKYDHGGLYRSKYIKFIKNWLEFFPLEQIHIVDGDAFARHNPAIELQRLEKFLGVKPMAKEDDFYFSNQKGFWCLRKAGCIGAEKGHKFPSLDENVEHMVRAFFKPLNEEFYRLLGRDFGWKSY